MGDRSVPGELGELAIVEPHGVLETLLNTSNLRAGKFAEVLLAVFPIRQLAFTHSATSMAQIPVPQPTSNICFGSFKGENTSRPPNNSPKM